LHHLILTAIQYAAEKLDNLFVIEVVHIFNHSWEEKLQRQVQISSEFVCEDVGGRLTQAVSKLSLLKMAQIIQAHLHQSLLLRSL